MEAPHWICRVMDQIADPAWWDGVILGLAIAAVPFVLWLWLSGN